MPKKFIIYLLLAVLTGAIGIASRKFGDYIPDFFAKYTGDTPWACAGYFFLRMLFPNWKKIYSALTAFIISVVVECSQLFHPLWLDKVRNTIIGALLLGFGFKWSDFICYISGIILGILIEKIIMILYEK
ncbi:MAG: DUF2809 domain-containing protein [Bacteroidia bacterium]|nr:DUF2809 domain-containing protein [Bacteroidia bacterium]